MIGAQCCRLLPRGVFWNGWALAEVEEQSHRDGNIFGRKIADSLLHLIFVKGEVLLFQASDRPVHQIGDHDWHKNQVHIQPQGFRGNVYDRSSGRCIRPIELRQPHWIMRLCPCGSTECECRETDPN
jgi:hypothetical protein